MPESFYGLALTAPDQLRQRVSWALLQFVPVSGNGDPLPRVEHFSLLQHAFGSYGSFLRELSVHPAMGPVFGQQRQPACFNTMPKLFAQ